MDQRTSLLQELNLEGGSETHHSRERHAETPLSCHVGKPATLGLRTGL